MKVNNRKKAAILAAILGSSFLGTASVDAANIGALVVNGGKSIGSQVVAVTGSYINSENIGIVQNVYDGSLNSDTAIFNTVDQVTGESSLFIRQYNYSTTNLIPNTVFDAQGKWNNNVAGVTDGAGNPHDVIRYNDFVYVASYDEGTIGVAKVAEDALNQRTNSLINLKEDLQNIEGITFGERAQLHGEAMTIVNGNLYVLVNANPQGGYTPYDPCYLMKYVIQEDGSLSYDGYTTMGKNSDSTRLNVYNNYILTTAIGGYQNMGDDKANVETTSINVAVMDKDGNFTGSRAITVPSNIKSEFRSMKILSDGTAYVMTGNINTAGTGMHAYLYKTTVGNLLSTEPIEWELIKEYENTSGEFVKLDAEENTDRVWVQAGNKIEIFTDGDTADNPTVSITAKEAGSNEQYNYINGWTTIKTDTITGELAQLELSEGEAYATNSNVNWDTDNLRTSSLTATEKLKYPSTKDKNFTVSLDNTKTGDLKNNILAGVYADNTSIKLTQQMLQGLRFQVENDVFLPVGFYVADGGSVISEGNTAGTSASQRIPISILTKTDEDGNSRTNAIWVDPSLNGGESLKITNCKAVNITMVGGNGGNGVAITKTSRWGEDSRESAKGGSVSISNDLNIKGADNNTWGITANKDNVISRYNNAGIYIDVNNSTISVGANANMDIYGNGATVNGENSKIIIGGGGAITVPKGTDYGYYSLAAYEGSISINLGTGGATPGSSDVKLEGDIFVLNDENTNASVNVALTTANSYLKGIIDNGDTANLYLRNGATWINEAQNTRYYQDNEDVGNGEMSRVTNFYGGDTFENAGIIKQTADSKLLTIDNYSGNALVLYSHDAENPTTIYGGDVRIGTAATDSAITLRTDNVGIDTNNDELVSDVLNSLAGKLYYEAYVNGENNINGMVEIAEGLTASSASMQTGYITFSEIDGKGSYGTGEGAPIIPSAQNVTKYTKAIVGNETDDTVYVYSGVLKENVYNFVKEETTITVSDNTVDAGTGFTDKIGASVSGAGVDNSVNINLNGNTIIIVNNNDGNSAGIAAIDGGVVEFDNAGTISVSATGTGKASALFANDGGKILIHNAAGGAIDLSTSSDNASDGAVVRALNGSEISVDGLVNIVADGSKCANEAISVDGSKVEIAGGTIKAENGAEYAIHASGTDTAQGIVNINMQNNTRSIASVGTNKVVLAGNISAEENGIVNIGLNGSASSWSGDNVGDANDGQLNLYVNNGASWTGNNSGNASVVLDKATWTGNNTGAIDLLMDNGATWKGYNTNGNSTVTIKNASVWYNNNTGSDNSVINKFVGATGDEAAGVIDMTGSTSNLVIDDYSGNTIIAYSRDGEDPTNVLGGTTTIKNASDGSIVTLRTDNKGINYIDKDEVLAVLDNLAKKLYYTSYATENNLAGYVEIAEGLTASSVSKFAGNIVFGGEAGQGSMDDASLTPDVVIPDRQIKDTFDVGIYNNTDSDFEYTAGGVLKDGVYNFNQDTTINATNNQVLHGPWALDGEYIATGISAEGTGDRTIINMNGNDLTVKAQATSTMYGTGMSAVNQGIVEINNVGNVDVTGLGYKSYGGGLFVNGGGEIHIHNTGVVTANANNSGAIIKTKGGTEDTYSKVIIDGLVDFDLSGGAGEILSANSGLIEVGGGNINAGSSSGRAIYATGQFVGEQYGTVNVNVVKDADGNIISAGNNKTTILGSVFTDGGMNCRGIVNIGLNGSDSYWKGNYTEYRGYGVADFVNAYIKVYLDNGADWTGYAKGVAQVDLNNGATWHGYDTWNQETWESGYTPKDSSLTIRNSAVWYNTNTSSTNSRFGTLTGATNDSDTVGVIDMSAGTSNLVVDNYSGKTLVVYAHDEEVPTNIIGGDVTIKSAAENSVITLRTNNTGVEAGNAEQVNSVLDSLAHKLYYTAYINGTDEETGSVVEGERNLSGYVEIAEGLTASAVVKNIGDIAFSEETGQGSLKADVTVEPESEGQTKDSFNAPILGDAAKDTAYVEDKVLKDGVYEFTKEETAITVANNTIAGGPWVNSGVGAAISAVGEGNKTEINLNGNKLNVNGTHTSNHSTGISAINKGVVEINNPGDMTLEATGTGQTAAIFANGGGEVYIHNGEGGTVIARAHASGVDNGAAIKTMNGTNGVESKIIIDGMVDVVADAKDGANEAVSAVASRIEIGGGNIEAINGAWAAIRAYGEFTSQNYGIVNVNVTKDEDGNIIGAGNRKTTITGDFVTNGGMGTKGQISVGLSGEDSYWHGKYTDNDGYGVTPGQLGSVNLWIEDGAHWTGYSSGSVNVNITGEGSYWDGYSTSSKMLLNLSDGAIWKNSNASKTSSIGNFIGNGGYIENAGGVTIDNYSGNTTVIYKHDAETPTNILGGDVTIKSAAENSAITLRTDNAGITIEDAEQVNSVLDSLAHKLYYTAYINKAQDNLDGYVEIAEGLTSSSVSKAIGEIEFSEETGQGSLLVSGGTEGGGEEPEQPGGGEEPEQKPVEEEIKGAITGDSLTDKTDKNPYKDLVSTDENNNTVIDFGKLDKDEVGEDKPDSEKVDKVKIESEESEGGKNSVIAAGASKPVILDLAGKDLDVSGDATNEAIGIQATGGDVTIKNAGAVTITAKAENGSASAIYAKGAADKANVTIENTGTLKLVANGNANDAVLHADVNSNVNITGNVDITETNGKVAVEVANNSSVTIGGGVIGDADGVAVQVTEDGKINIGGNDKVNIKGKIIFGVAAKTENEELAPVMYSRMLMRSLPEANVNVDLTTAGSTLEDNLEYQGDGTNNVANVQISGEGSAWTADSIGGISLNVVLDNSGVWKGYHEDDKDYSALNMQISNGAQWYNEATDATTIDKLVGADVNDKDAKTGFIRMSEAKEAGLTVKDYSGETTFIYNHDTENNILGGDVTINKAADGSIVNVRTGSIGSMDKKEISKVLQALAEKVIAKDAEGNVLDNADKISGQAQIAEGMITSSSSLRFGDIKFDTGSGVVDEASINCGATAGDYETAMMSGAKSAMTSSAMMWRAEANDIMKRMGDLRMAEGEQGIWAKYYGTKQEMEAQNAKYTNNYKAYQLGYDKKVGDWTVGVAASYGDGESTYANGRGENSVVSLGLYGAWNGNDGQYVDVIMKRSKLDNEYNLNGNVFIGQIEADYETWATSVSAEYGKRFETKKGFYVEPNAELTLGRVEGESYNTSLSLGGERLNVQQDDYDTLVGRLGLRIGQKLNKASYYAKFAVAKEFAGDFDTKYSTIGKSGAVETKETSMSFKDTWYEMQIGGTAQLSDNSYIYASYERNFGADVEQKWRIDAGLRFSF